MSNYTGKAPFNDWWYWSDVLAKRLRLAGDLYRQNDERDRATELLGVSRKLNELFMAVAQKGQRAKTAAEKTALKPEEEAAIFEGVGIWRDMLSALPFTAEAMEGFFGVTWEAIDPRDEQPGDKKKGKAGKGDAQALELFWGPKAPFDEGIRSGLPADGGLPGILLTMLQAERSSSNRTPTEYKNEQDTHQYYGREQKNTMKGPGMGGGM